MIPRRTRAAALGAAVALIAAAGAAAQTRTYTSDTDFDEGLLVNLNHNAPFNDQLRLNPTSEPFPFINVACSARGTVVRIETNTGQVLGEYRSSPDGTARNPSRTTVDLFGNVWCTNRDEAGGDAGSVIKIGIIIGGLRGNKLPGGGFEPDPNGEYIAPPFLYNTCVDRDGDQLIRTSRGLGNILPWTNPGGVNTNGGVSSAEDEAILIYKRLPGAPNARHVSVDRDNDVWVAGYPFLPRMFHKLDGDTGAILASFNAATFGGGGYGGFIDRNGILWSASISQNAVLRYDPATGLGRLIGVPQSYGLGADSNGFVWNATWTDNRIVKIAPDGTVQPGFPRPTGGAGCRGVTVTTADDNVWVANSNSGTVSRLDNSGNIRKVIGVGATPTGVAPDRAGKVWVTNYDSHNVMRIDPNAGPDGLGAVDLTVPLGAGAGPYNYSDMTGSVAIGVTVQQGTWDVVYDGALAGLVWGTISWNGLTPAGTNIVCEVRAADTRTGLPGVPFTPIAMGVPFHGGGVVGRFIEMRTTLSRNAGVTETPVLLDLTVSAPLRPAMDITPRRTPNRIILSRPYTVYVAVLGSPEFDAGRILGPSVRFGPTGTEAAPVRAPTIADFNGDLVPDALFGFRTRDCRFQLGQTTGLLKGSTTTAGLLFESSDSVLVQP